MKEAEGEGREGRDEEKESRPGSMGRIRGKDKTGFWDGLIELVGLDGPAGKGAVSIAVFPVFPSSIVHKTLWMDLQDTKDC